MNRGSQHPYRGWYRIAEDAHILTIILLCPIGDSNPCFCLERATSWATRRMGLKIREDYTVLPQGRQGEFCECGKSRTILIILSVLQKNTRPSNRVWTFKLAISTSYVPGVPSDFFPAAAKSSRILRALSWSSRKKSESTISDTCSWRFCSSITICSSATCFLSFSSRW